jgi:hypothetical protein
MQAATGEAGTVRRGAKDAWAGRGGVVMARSRDLSSAAESVRGWRLEAVAIASVRAGVSYGGQKDLSMLVAAPRHKMPCVDVSGGGEVGVGGVRRCR